MDYLIPEDEGTTYLRNVVRHSPMAMKRHVPEDRNEECFVDYLIPEDEGTTYLRNVVRHTPMAMKRHVPEDRNPRPFHSFPHCIQANFQLVGLSGNSKGAPVPISGVGGIGCTQGLRERVRAPVKKKNLRVPNMGGPANSIYTKSENLTLSCGGTWARSERANLLYTRQIMVLRKAKTYATIGPRAAFRTAGHR